MSTTIDNRVVEMQFNNQQFERNVQTSMSTLDKLKQSLNLTGAAKGFENVDSASKKINFSALGGAVETIQSKFSALEVMGITALANITNSAVNAGKRIANALTIKPITTGFSEYETQINAVQTILANTESKGTTLDDVNNALDTLNEYADKTIYNFTQMTRNIGTFTAAGVDLDTSVKSIQGIANLAAVSGSTSQQASTAMYQLSQALAAGKVSLMDWNSVVNAGMGGQVFQEALKRTAKAMGTDVDAIIKKYGSFRESLTEGEWLTTDVLTKTLEQFTMAAEEGSDEWNNFKKQLMDDGYAEKQAEEILKMANTATNAATKVKTFTQLWDTLQEAAQSGWTQTWEIIVGDFEEAKELLTKVSDVIGEMINNSAKARNELLQGWKDAGGRVALLDGVWNVFDGIMNVVNPIKEAFREIFPPMTVDKLVYFTAKFKALTEIFKEFTSNNGDKIKSAFKGIFSVIDIGWTLLKELGKGLVEIVGHFSGLGGGILDAAGSLGDWLTNIRDTVKETDIFGQSVEKITTFIENAITKVKDFGRYLKESFTTVNYEGFATFMKNVWNIVKSIGSSVGKILAPLAKGFAALFENANLFDMLNTGLLAGGFVGITNFVGGFKEILENVVGEDGLFDQVKGAFEDLRGCFEAYQNNLNAQTLMKIATAIGILAAAIFIVSSIDGEALDRSLGAMTILFGELIGSLALFTRIDTGKIKGTLTKTVPLMIGMSIGILILSAAMKRLSAIDTEGLTKGLIAIGVLMTEIAVFLRTFKFDGKLAGAAVGIVILSTAMLILAKAVENFGAMDWNTIGKGLAAIGALLLELGIFTKLTGNAKSMISVGTGMVLLGAAMKILVSVMRDFGAMDWTTIGKGLTAMGGALLEIAIATKIMPKNMVGMATGLVIAAAALTILVNVMQDFGGMSWSVIGKGLAAMGGALVEIAIALRLMNGTTSGSIALIIAAGALAIMVPVLQALGGMSWESIGKGLLTIAGAFTVIGVAGYLLTPLVPTLLGLAAAFALFGIATLGIGAGLLAISAGLTALSVAGAAGATAFVAALSVIVVGVLDLIPTIASKIGEAILTICQVIIECAPQIADTILSVLLEVLTSLATYTPQIVDTLFTFVIGLLDGLAARLPELIQSAVNLIGAFFRGVVDALSGIDTENLVKGIIGAGLLAGLMLALSAVASLIPGAMLGVLGMGVVIAEMALVLAAIGALAQIPGLSWLIEEGGNFLQTIGTAIGQFVGGIVGGIAKGATSTLPEVGSNLSSFMNNAKPFLNGIKGIDSSVLDGAKAIAGAVLALTGANLLDRLTSWLTGGSSLSDFGVELAEFGPQMAKYAKSVAGIDASAVTASANAAKSLVKVAEAIPNDGGVVSWFTGDNDLSSFAKKLVPFGTALKSYSTEVSGIDITAINSSVTGAKRLATLMTTLSNTNTNGVHSFVTALSTLGNTSIDAFVNAFRNASIKLESIGSNIFVVIANSMKAKQNMLLTAVNPAITSLLRYFTDKLPQFLNSGKTIMVNLAKGLNGNSADVRSAIDDPIKASMVQIRGYYKNFYDAGAYISSGLASGMRSKLWSVKSAANEMANAASTAARAALLIKSPSRIFYGIGEFVIEGFTNALNDGERSVYGTAADMADFARTGFNSAIGKINDVFNNGIDTQPTIRPVLDLSDVRSGANTINGILGMSPFVGAMSSINSISSMMGQRNQNGTTADIISELSKLRGDLQNAGGNTYQINGITYDDGSAVSNAVATLIRATTMQGRV